MTATLAGVLWDMDGTLVDSEPIWIAQQLVMTEQHGGTWSTEQGLALVGADMHDTARAMQAAGVELEAAELVAGAAGRRHQRGRRGRGLAQRTGVGR